MAPTSVDIACSEPQSLVIVVAPMGTGNKGDQIGHVVVAPLDTGTKRDKVRHLADVATSTFSGTSFTFSSSFTCPFAPLSSDEINTIIREWGVNFHCNSKEYCSSGDTLNSFIFTHKQQDISRFVHFLSEVMGVIFAQNSDVSRELIIVNENT
jgi:hypothetical protein